MDEAKRKSSATNQRKLFMDGTEAKTFLINQNYKLQFLSYLRSVKHFIFSTMIYTFVPP